MKVLNIDTLAQVKRQIILGGATHNVRETSVQQFIDALKASEELEAAAASGKAKESASEQIERTVKIILDSIPTAPAADLRAAPLEALQTIMLFIRGELDPQAPAAAQGEQGKRASTGGDQPGELIEELDLGYLVARTMRTYAMGYQAVMEMPIRAFWTISGFVERIRSDEAQLSLEIASASQSADAARQLYERLDAQAPAPVKKTGKAIVASAALDEKGLNELRNLVG